MQDSGCREAHQLSDWLLGKLSAQEALDVLLHVEQCSACEQAVQVAEREVDPLVASLREPELTEPHEDEPECGRLLHRLGKLWDAPAAQGLEDADLTQIREYRLVGRLGAGGIGVVYKAVHAKLQKTVALKVLSLKLERRQDAIQRFLREMEAIGRLDHPNIIRAIDAGEVDGRLYLAMDYVDGVDLHRFVKSNGPLPVAEACEVIRQAACGLQYAHDQGIVHRDVKPANLLMDRAGFVKVVDLGLARFERPANVDTGDAMLTRGGAPIGTYDYMAPEQATEPQRSGRPADVYGLGCTLHYLLTGKPPYGGDTEAQRLLAHRDAPIPSLAAGCADVPAALDRVFGKMVAKQATERYQSMLEVVNSLEACGVRRGWSDAAGTAAGSELGALVDSIPPQDSGQSHRSTLDQARQSTPARKVPDEKPTPSRRRLPGSLIAAALAATVLLVVGIEVFRGRPRLTIENTVRDVRIAIMKDGQRTEPVDLHADSSIKMRPWPGTYEFRLFGDPPGVKLSTSRITMQRGEEATVMVIPDVTIRRESLGDAREYQRQFASNFSIDEQIENSIGMKLVLIPPGKFFMGVYGSKLQKLKNEMARRDTDILASEYERGLEIGAHRFAHVDRPFYMAVHEVTQQVYEEVRGGSNPSYFGPRGEGFDQIEGEDHHRLPVENVSWFDAVKFCNMLSQREELRPCYEISGDTVSRVKGNGYRLPMEMEWEWACRAGAESLFCFGDDEGTLAEYAHYGRERSHAVGALRANAFGLFDVHGNVWEWCWDFHGEPRYASPVDADSPEAGGPRVLRGGAFQNLPYSCSSALRGWASAETHSKYRGFRVVREIR